MIVWEGSDVEERARTYEEHQREKTKEGAKDAALQTHTVVTADAWSDDSDDEA